jgi:hypothetical protein
VNLTVDSRGIVEAACGEPEKAKIDAVFAADPGFANEYRKIANTRELQAVAEEYQAYSEAFSAATTDAGRAEVWRRYSSYISAIGERAGNMALREEKLEPGCAAG